MTAHNPTRGILAVAMSSLLLFAVRTTAAAQRQPPQISDAGVRNPLGSSVVANGIVTWGYWGIDLPTCKRSTGEMECLVNVGNGVNEPHELCLVTPQLKKAGSASGSPMTFVRVEKTNANSASVVSSQSMSQVCASYAPHDALNLVLTSPVPAGGGGLSLRVTLVERWRRAQADSTARAEADLPITRVSDARTSKRQ